MNMSTSLWHYPPLGRVAAQTRYFVHAGLIGTLMEGPINYFTLLFGYLIRVFGHAMGDLGYLIGGLEYLMPIWGPDHFLRPQRYLAMASPPPGHEISENAH